VGHTSLDVLIERHIAARAARMDAVPDRDGSRPIGRVAGVDGPNLLSRIEEAEAAGLLAIVKYRPCVDGEARLKLTYLAAYLIATKSSLTVKEMRAALEFHQDQPPPPNS